MRNYTIEQRACRLAHYIVDSKDTVRGAAKKFGVSKSTVHTDVTKLQFLSFLRCIELSGNNEHVVLVRISFAIKM